MATGTYIAAELLNSRMDDVHDDIDGDLEVRLAAQWRAIRNRTGEIIEFVGQNKTTEESEKTSDASNPSRNLHNP